MNTQPDLKFLNILDNVRRHFDFLLKRGFRIASAIYVGDRNEHLQIILFSQDCIINICCDDRQMDLGLSTLGLYESIGFFDVHHLITLIQGKEQVIAMPGFAETAQLMEQYMDEILLRLMQIQCYVEENENGQLPWSNCPFLLSAESVIRALRHQSHLHRSKLAV